MDNLMSLLSKGKPEEAPEDPAESMDPEASEAPEDEGFKAAASEAMDAVTSGDVDAFSAALKTCIEMSG